LSAIEPSGQPGAWQSARVIKIIEETERAKSYRLHLTRPTPHLAGQHFIVRLTAPDGYQASRSYSVASAPEDPSEIELTVERLPDGEVSTFLHDVVVVGDELEVRGPIGGFFVWRGETPALLVGGGSGIVPLMAMLRLSRLLGRSDLVHLIVSVRSPDDLYYRDELRGPEATVIYTRRSPAGEGRPSGHLVAHDLAPLVVADATAYICGSSPFAEAATTLVLGSGIPVEQIRIERFGPSG
jgi:ferredoxin-NADP reductase